jgi:hypothetical protein
MTQATPRRPVILINLDCAAASAKPEAALTR